MMKFSYLHSIRQNQEFLVLLQRTMNQVKREGFPIPWSWQLKRSVMTLRLFKDFGRGDTDFEKCFYHESGQGTIHNPYYQADLIFKENRVVLLPSRRRIY